MAGNRFWHMDAPMQFFYAVVTLFVVLDPVLSIPPFLSLTKKFSEAERERTADKAIIAAGVIAVIFLLGGPFVMGALGVTLGSFKVAGGIILGLLGLEMVLSFSLSKDEKNAGKEGVAVIIATPLLTGPGLITALVVISAQSGFAIAFAALAVALFVAWVMLRKALSLKSWLGAYGLEALSRVMGLLLLAVAVEFIIGGLAGLK